MGSIIGHRIDYNGVGVWEASGTYTQQNLPRKSSQVPGRIPSGDRGNWGWELSRHDRQHIVNEWMNEWMNEWTNERMNEWTKEPRNQGTKERRNEGTKERTKERRNEGRKERRKEGRRKEGRNEWMNEWMNERYLCTVVTSIFKIGFQISREDNSTWPKDSAFTAVKMDAKL